MNEPFSWLAVFSKLGIPGTAILAVVLGIAGAVGTNVGDVRERAMAFLDYERNETHNHTHYNNSDGNTTTNAPSVVQAHEHPEIEERLSNLEQGQVAIYGRLTNLEQGQAAIKADMAEFKTDLEGVKTDMEGVKADLVGVKAGLAGVKAGLEEVKAGMQKLLEKQ